MSNPKMRRALPGGGASAVGAAGPRTDGTGSFVRIVRFDPGSVPVSLLASVAPIRLLITARDEVVVTLPGRVLTCPPHSALFLPPEAVCQLTGQLESACAVVKMRASGSGGGGPALPGTIVSLGVLADCILSVAVTGAAAPDHVRLSFFEAALDDLLAGVLYRAGLEREDGASGRLTLDRALRIIDARHTEPAFSVEALADALRISRRALYRSFEGHVMGPAAALRVRRAQTAVGLLADHDVPRSRRSISRLAGFSGISAMERAIREADASVTSGDAPGESRPRIGGDAGDVAVIAVRSD
jgi:AraC-like DNA-binding protein